ncbi:MULTISPECIES: TetR family transcriptional regulator [Rhodopseudomonas]|nr:MULTISPECIES: TetR family transcriptional regulator [Rhodopseudomonas]MDF3809942.1 TetR family transcriptional regulator [Rhodopseudomonas sp. BAL398]WOK20498.1 TetR family transcriptional regulator [Rhodopseudomonas sp. BAL398]
MRENVNVAALAASAEEIHRMAAKVAVKRRGRPRKTEQPKSVAILQAALAAFAGHGFDGTNLRQIATEAEIDVALIPHQFGSKLGLWRAVVDDIAERTLPDFRSIIERGAPETSAGETLQLAMARMIDHLCDTPQLAMFVVNEVGEQGERFEYVYDRLVRPMHDLLLPPIRAAHASGAIKDVNPDFFFATFTAAISMTVVMRPFIARFSSHAKKEQAFRRELKRALLAVGFA